MDIIIADKYIYCGHNKNVDGPRMLFSILGYNYGRIILNIFTPILFSLFLRKQGTTTYHRNNINHFFFLTKICANFVAMRMLRRVIPHRPQRCWFFSRNRCTAACLQQQVSSKLMGKETFLLAGPSSSSSPGTHPRRWLPEGYPSVFAAAGAIEIDGQGNGWTGVPIPAHTLVEASAIAAGGLDDLSDLKNHIVKYAIEEHSRIGVLVQASEEILRHGGPPLLLEEAAKMMQTSILFSSMRFSLASYISKKSISPGALHVPRARGGALYHAIMKHEMHDVPNTPKYLRLGIRKLSNGVLGDMVAWVKWKESGKKARWASSRYPNWYGDEIPHSVGRPYRGKDGKIILADIRTGDDLPSRWLLSGAFTRDAFEAHEAIGSMNFYASDLMSFLPYRSIPSRRRSRFKAKYIKWKQPIRNKMSYMNKTTRLRQGEMWLNDALHEHSSIASFLQVIRILLNVKASPSLLSRTAGALIDEIRHAQIKFTLAAVAIDKIVLPKFYIPPEPSDPGEVDMRAFANSTFHDGCLGERTGAEALWAEAKKHPPFARVFKRMAKEELAHAELADDIMEFLVQRGRIENGFAGFQSSAPLSIGHMTMGSMVSFNTGAFRNTALAVLCVVVLLMIRSFRIFY